MSDAELIKNSDEDRYELRVGDERVGFIDYRGAGDAVELVHTEVDPTHGGKGYASMLVNFALSDLRDDDSRVIPTCSYVARYIERHPEFADLVNPPASPRD